jgi:hypothetical protein
MSTSNSDASHSAAKKVLVAYFSHTGTTRSAAQYISKSIHADIFEIQAVDPYPEDYEEVKERAKQELESSSMMLYALVIPCGGVRSPLP